MSVRLSATSGLNDTNPIVKHRPTDRYSQTQLEGSKKLNMTMTGAKNTRGFKRWKNIKDVYIYI